MPGFISAQFSALLQEAEFLFSDSRPRQALQLARRCLELDPQNTYLLNFAGVCAVTLGNQEQAEQFWRRAIAINPALAEVHFNLGLMLAKSSRKNEAGHCYRQAISLDPLHAEAYCNLGNLLSEASEAEKAEACYRQAIALCPGFAATYYNLGNLLLKRGQFEEAEQYFRQALTLNPEDAQAHSQLGFLLARRKCMPEAEQCYRQAIALDSGFAEAYSNLGLLLGEARRFEEAIKCFRLAITSDPNSAEIFSNLGNVLEQCGHADEAEQCYQKAILLNPGSATAYCNLGVLLANSKRDTEAEQLFRKALACNSRHALTHLNLAYLLLAAGRWEEGWAYHGSRYAYQGMPEAITIMSEACSAQWQGEPLAGKSLLVLSEQGFGDAIQFCRYLQVLKDQGAAHITLLCRTELKPLFATLSGVDTLMDNEDVNRGIALHDYWVLLLSIPFHCKTTPQTIPARIPYLHALPSRLERWSAHLPRGCFRVGLAWKGNQMHSNDAHRSLPSLAVLNQLWSVPGVKFASLQKGQGEEEATHPVAGRPLLELGSAISDFADTAAIISCLDLVICVDTAIAHLAGALGKPCWVMLPAYKTDWRWMNERIDSPWYPATMRLFRQQQQDDWTAMVADITQALTLASSNSSS